MLNNEKIIITDSNGEIIPGENKYSSYSFDSQYGSVSSVFNVTLVEPETDILPGYGIQLLVDGKTAFRGIIERKNHVTGKDTNQITLTGKDRSLILVENKCNSWKDFTNKTPLYIVDNLIAQTNFYVKPKGSIDEISDSSGFNNADDIDSINSAYLDDVNNNESVNSRADVTTYDQGFTNLSSINHYKINIGDFIYSKISDLVKSQGFEILYQTDGTLYIGNLSKKRANDEILYKLIHKRNGEGNNIISSSLVDDISGRYSTIQIFSQSENYRFNATYPNVNENKIATDSTLPIKKFFVEQINGNKGSAEKYAIRIREDQRIEGYQVIYEVPGHIAENGEFWEINRLINVYDEYHDIYNALVLYGRTFSFDVSSGHRTVLRLSHERFNELEL